MTDVYLHGILAKEYQSHFKLNLNSSTHVLKAIDANREGFIARIFQLQREGFYYDVIVNKKRIKKPEDFKRLDEASRIDLVPIIVGSGEIIIGFLFPGAAAAGGVAATAAAIAAAVLNAGIAYLLTPKPDLGLPAEQDISAEAAAQKESYIFSGNINLVRQGTPLPLGYGRLKVGSSVVQASVRSFPLIKPDSQSMNSNNFVDQTEEGSLVKPITANSIAN
ncbi:MAG TPA: hypothetical protein DEG69_05805 [Flavobacteriaceae bacterium]|nr:hypothetical protein [Flavobacteriaceae bacterium]|tara:strand:- start:3830 stop:4492 length:663 start_codon:yes stop_codon:yes gene_type:complete